MYSIVVPGMYVVTSRIVDYKRYHLMSFERLLPHSADLVIMVPYLLSMVLLPHIFYTYQASLLPDMGTVVS